MLSSVGASGCRLVKILDQIDCKVNLIVFNTYEGSIFQPSTTEDVLAFRSVLIQVAAAAETTASVVSWHLRATACLIAGDFFQEAPEIGYVRMMPQAGRVCTVRDSRGDDEMAACGQLGVVPNSKLIPLLKPPAHLEARLLAAA